MQRRKLTDWSEGRGLVLFFSHAHATIKSLFPNTLRATSFVFNILHRQTRHRLDQPVCIQYFTNFDPKIKLG